MMASMIVGRLILSSQVLAQKTRKEDGCGSGASPAQLQEPLLTSVFSIAYKDGRRHFL